MTDMVSQVVSVLDEKQYFPISNIQPPEITGEKDGFDKTKERDRKEIKRYRPNVSLKWDGQRWRVIRRHKGEKYTNER